MPSHKKLGRATDMRLSILRGLVTTLIVKGKVTTTVTRAGEVSRIAEKLISSALKEKDNFTTREVIVSRAKLDGKSRKVLVSKTSKSGAKYDVVSRETKTEMRQSDEPSRQAARRRAMLWLNKGQDADGKAVNPVNMLFDTVAPKYEGRNGGYTRITKIGPRRGDSAEMAVLELL